MSRYYTPVDVARALAKHAPRRLSTVLEPAVGTGVLLDPLKERLRSARSKIICIDKDRAALAQLRAKYLPLLRDNLEIVRADFLKWAVPTPSKHNEGVFDCILMNPPFDARRAGYVELDCSAEMPGVGDGTKRVPVEIGFVLKSVRLLRPGGRLLAIVPSSIVASLSTAWLREYLLKVGAVRYVHELPHFTFEGLGARVYLFVFEKKERQRSMLLLNHDLAKPESIKIKKKELLPDFRFDYGLHNARREFGKLKERKRNLKWLAIKDVAEVLRGGMKSPKGATHALHTTEYEDGFWVAGDKKKKIKKCTTERGVRTHDLIVKRVGKGCSKTFGVVVDACGCAASDCIVLIRPRKAADDLRLLFALRTFFGSELAPALLERGTGAPYITVAELPKVQLPVNLAEAYPVTFAKYLKAVKARKFEDMLSLESRVRKTFKLGS